VPQAQVAQKGLKYASAPPSYDQASNSSKVHRREGYLASVQMKLVIFTLLFCSSAGVFFSCSFSTTRAVESLTGFLARPRPSGTSFKDWVYIKIIYKGKRIR
jgi:hypothetical protein